MWYCVFNFVVAINFCRSTENNEFIDLMISPITANTTSKHGSLGNERHSSVVSMVTIKVIFQMYTYKFIVSDLPLKLIYLLML